MSAPCTGICTPLGNLSGLRSTHGEQISAQVAQR